MYSDQCLGFKIQCSFADKHSFHDIGLFTRRMALSFHKMSFSQVSHFVDLLKMYLDNCEIDVPHNEMESSLDVSMQSVENDVEENGSSNTRFKLYIFFHPVNCFLYRCAAWARGALPYMTYMGYAGGQGLGFDLSVLDMVYKYVRVCPYYKQGIACATDLICRMKLVGNPSIQKKITIT